MKKYLAITLGILMLASILVASDATKTETVTTATVDSPAPNFTLTDVAGKTHSLADFKGKFVVLEWVNFDCPFVKKHYGAKNMQSLQAAYIKKDVVWLSICSSAKGKQGYFEGKDLTDRITKEGLSSTAYLIDTDGTVGKMYGAKTTPNMYVINPEGTLVYAGAIDDTPTPNPDDIKTAKNYVQLALDASMAGKPVATKATAPYGCGVKY
jgi:peroxiredoxin